MVEAIIFDLYGTLTNGQARPEDKIVAEFGLNSSPDYYHFVENVVCGTRYKDEESYLTTLIEKFNLENSDQNRRRLKDIFARDLEGEIVRPETVFVLESLGKEGIKLGLISDLPNPAYDLPRKHGFKRYFVHVTYSYETGLLKPDHRPFVSTLNGVGTTTEETWMVGNSLKFDIVPARELGMRALLLDPEDKNKEYTDKIRNLKEVLDLV